MSDQKRHPEEDTELHLLGYLYHVPLESQRPIKSEPDGQDSLGARRFARQELKKLVIGDFARQGIDLWPKEGIKA